MKILATLILLPILAGFYAVLLAPAPALAAACPNNVPITVSCECGVNNLIPGGGNYCDNGTMRSGIPTPIGGSGMEQAPETAPTIVTSGKELIELITKIGNWVFAGLMAVAGFFLVYAGFLWVTAGGNPENVKKSREMVINALIGAAIGLLARGAVQVVRSILGG